MRQDNNFDFIRVVAALAVIWSHSFRLIAPGEPEVYPGQSYGGLGLMIFFSLSGYLVSQSWERDPHVFNFAVKRLLRIVPGLVAATLFVAFVIGPKVTTLPLRDYFMSPAVYDYVIGTVTTWNMTDRLPGVFDENRIHTVNSPLWSIPLEMKWYGFLAVLGVFGATKHRYALPIMVAVLVVSRFFLPFSYPSPVLIDLGLCFLIGASLYTCRADVAANGTELRVFVGCASVVLWLLHMEQLALTIAVPYSVVAFGNLSTDYVRNFGRFGDLSYGMYIYAYPIQQVVTRHTHGYQLLSFIVSLAIIVPVAWASWHVVEKPAMNLRRFLKRKNGAELHQRPESIAA